MHGQLYLLSRGSRGGASLVQEGPLAVSDTRDIAAAETTVAVNVLTNDLRVGGAVVSIGGFWSDGQGFSDGTRWSDGLPNGATATVVGQAIQVTRIGSAAGSYSLTYNATTPYGSSAAVLSGSVAALTVAPTAVNDTRNLSGVEITVLVDILANDLNVGNGTVEIVEIDGVLPYVEAGYVDAGYVSGTG